MHPSFVLDHYSHYTTNQNSPMTTQTIAFIGAGNMARSLIGGLVAGGYPAHAIIATDPLDSKCHALQQHFSIETSHDNRLAVERADIVVLAVKPQIMRDVATDLAASIQQRQPLVVSIAAGIRAATLDEWLGGHTALVRCMPNTPALVQCGATGLYANPRVSQSQHEAAESIMRAVGLTVWVDDEALLDSVTALSGGGPAYFFLVIEALENAGVELGLTRDQARLLALETAFGAAKMALESDESPAELRARVTSPGGTTEQALAVLQDGELEALFAKALRAARQRCHELSDLLSQNR